MPLQENLWPHFLLELEELEKPVGLHGQIGP